MKDIVYVGLSERVKSDGKRKRKKEFERTSTNMTL